MVVFPVKNGHQKAVLRGPIKMESTGAHFRPVHGTGTLRIIRRHQIFGALPAFFRCGGIENR